MDLLHFKKIINPVVMAGINATFTGLNRGEIGTSARETRLFISRERVCRKTTDLAAKHWARTREWPIIDKEIARYLFFRFSSASVFLDEIQPLRPDFNAEEPKVLSWLLVNYWRKWGHGNWLRQTFGEGFMLRRLLLPGR